MILNRQMENTILQYVACSYAQKKYKSQKPYLMCAANQIKVMLSEEFRHDLGTKSVTYTTIIISPRSYILIGIRPEQIAQQSLVWNVSRSGYSPNLIHVMKIRR